MSNYPIWWDTTITIFHKYEDKITRIVSWYSYKLTDCFWKYVGNKVTVANVTINSEQATCRIPKNDLFVEPYDWEKLTAEAKQTYFTIATGDIIVKGEVTDTIDEYTSGHRSTDFIKKYKDLQGCMQVGKVAIDTGVGRCCEHYFVTGE